MMRRLAQSDGITQGEARGQIMAMIGGICIGRPGMPDEEAELATFLAAPRAGSIYGANHVMDGGTMPTT